LPAYGGETEDFMSLVKQSPIIERSLEYRVASTLGERAGAFQLVYQSYLRTGLGTPNLYRMRVTPHQLCDSSQIFVGLHDGQVVSTVTLVADGPMGLPMEDMFSQEVEDFRAEGRRVAEVSCLADRRQDSRRFLESFSQLTRLMAQFARYQGIHNLLISVHPRHARFYSRYFGFRPISDRVANCPHVQDHPAIGLNLDFELYDLEKPDSWYDNFGEWMTREQLQPCTIPAAEKEFLKGIARESCHRPGDAAADTSDHADRKELVEIG
jgi:hypothetical protein